MWIPAAAAPISSTARAPPIQNKHFLLAEVYAILLVILVLGMLMDYGMGVLTNLLCPHSRLERVAR